MSIMSAACAEYHNKEMLKWKELFSNCKTFEEFQAILAEFKKVEFSE